MHRTAYLLLILATLSWGGNVVAGKIAVGHVSPMLLTTLRWSIAFAILLVIGARHIRGDLAIVRTNLTYLLAMGAFGLGTFNVLMYLSLNFTTAINVSILQAAVPMIVFAANFVIFGIRLGWAQFLGFLVTVAGVLLIAGQGSFARLLALDVNAGDALMLLAVVFYGGFTVALRNMPRLHWQSMMIVMCFAAMVASAIFAVMEWATGHGRWPDGTGWMAALFAAIFPSVLAQTFFVRGTQLIGANRSGLFVNLVPVFGTLLSIVLLGEQFFAYHAFALVLVLGGIGLAERSHQRPRGGG